MRVGDLLRAKSGTVITIRPDADVRAAAHILIRNRIGGLPVVDDGGLVGFVSERDIVRAVDTTKGVVDLTVDRIMQQPAPSCRAGDTLMDVMARMTAERLRHLVVLEGDRVLDVLSVGDLVKHRLRQLELETGVLRDYVAAHRAADM